jgi:hypothetical protein
MTTNWTLEEVLELVRTQGISGVLDNEGEYLGGGCYRGAYALGDWVVKEHHPGVFSKANVRRFGLQPCMTYTVNGCDVQPRLTPIYENTDLHDLWSEWYQLVMNIGEGGSDNDLHSGNLGYDSRGVLYAFDW